MMTRGCLAALAVSLTGCFGPSCDDEIYARRFDIPSHCKRSGTCLKSEGVVIDDGSGGDDQFSAGSFEMWPNQSVLVPVDDFRSELGRKPRLVAVLTAGAPLDPSAGQVQFDGQVASCTVSRMELTTQFEMICDVPPNVGAIGFFYGGAGLQTGEGYAAFDLSLYLEEATPTGSMKVCFG